MKKKSTYLQKPINRSKLRIKVGRSYYSIRRRIAWVRWSRYFARKGKNVQLQFLVFEHRTPLLRKLKDVDMWYQYNKIVNLKLAVAKLNGVVIHPGEVFSYWKLIGKPTRRKGYVDGMVLSAGKVTAGIGGGLCQLSNLIFWMALHSPLTVVERHRHGYDVFPDSNRTQPFGSGATCYYPHGDLMIKNETDVEYQLLVQVGEKYLEGQLRSSVPSNVRYEIIEKNPCIQGEFWGGYSRKNELYRKSYDLSGKLLNEEFLYANSARMMYDPLLSDKNENVT